MEFEIVKILSAFLNKTSYSDVCVLTMFLLNYLTSVSIKQQCICLITGQELNAKSVYILWCFFCLLESV